MSLKTCAHCDIEVLDGGDLRLEPIAGYDDRVCSACLAIWALSPEGQMAHCMTCRQELEEDAKRDRISELMLDQEENES